MILVAHNPGARRGAAVLALARAAIDRAGRTRREWPIHGGPPPQGERFERIWIAGGDGAARAAVHGLLRSGGIQAPICLIPAGTGNNLVQGLGIPLDPRDAIDLALRPADARAGSPVVERIDVLRADIDVGGAGSPGRWFPILMAGTFGFPSVIVGRYARLRRSAAGRLAAAAVGESIYTILSAFEILFGPAVREEIEIEHPGGRIAARAAALFIGNGPGIGGRFLPCPAARFDDGRLDICLIDGRGSRRARLDLAKRAGRGGHIGAPGVSTLQTPGPIEVRFPRGSSMGGLNADGDVVASCERVGIRVLSGALPVVLPRQLVHKRSSAVGSGPAASMGGGGAGPSTKR